MTTLATTSNGRHERVTTMQMKRPANTSLKVEIADRVSKRRTPVDDVSDVNVKSDIDRIAIDEDDLSKHCLGVVEVISKFQHSVIILS